MNGMKQDKDILFCIRLIKKLSKWKVTFNS